MRLFLNPQYFYHWLYELLTRPWSLGLPGWVPGLWFLLIVTFLILIVVTILKIIKLREAESAEMDQMLVTAAETKPERNQRWEQVLKSLEGDNPAEWKQAIIEADQMLDELVQTLRPSGENLGERLKSIEPSDFETIQDAWEAHKIRNRIAHEAGLKLEKHEALRALAHFRRVFEEFEYI